MRIIERNVSRLLAIVMIAVLLCGLCSCSKEEKSSQVSTLASEGSSSYTDSSSVEVSEADASSDVSSKVVSENEAIIVSEPDATTQSPSDVSGSQKEEVNQVALNDSLIHWFGRSSPDNDSVALEWSGSGFELCVTGGEVKAQIFALDNGDANCTWLGIYVDNMRIDKIRLESGNKWYTLVKGLPENKATAVKVVKLSEAQQGVAKVRGLTITGSLSAVTKKTRKIVWIGDSITAGFGVYGSASDPFTTETQDITATYGYKISEAFNAEAQFIAASGYGVATSNSGDTKSGLLPSIYPYTCFSKSADNKLWDFNSFQPDIVVVNLGTNDVAGGSNAQTLKNGVSSFLKQLRQYHPKAAIVWVYGFMIDGMSSEIRNEVDSFASTDKNTYYIQAKKINGSGEIGAVGHPSAAAHERLSKELKTELANILGW